MKGIIGTPKAVKQNDLDIAKSRDGRTMLYATKGKIKKVGHAEVNSLIIKGSQQKSNFNNNILPSSEKVNNKNSVKDYEGKTLTEQQGEYFKNSKVRDADGKSLDRWQELADLFAIEKGTAPQTLLAVVTENNSATVPKDSISNPTEKVNNSSENSNNFKQ